MAALPTRTISDEGALARERRVLLLGQNSFTDTELVLSVILDIEREAPLLLPITRGPSSFARYVAHDLGHPYITLREPAILIMPRRSVFTTLRPTDVLMFINATVNLERDRVLVLFLQEAFRNCVHIEQVVR
jgi:adenine/guanine phosphoribosyltransferase-like PRPP-binding protein